MKLPTDNPNAKLIHSMMESFNAEDYYIREQDNTLHFYGQMPRSIVTGWYFAGYYPEVLDDMRD